MMAKSLIRKQLNMAKAELSHICGLSKRSADIVWQQGSPPRRLGPDTKPASETTAAENH
jgi:hypothetical protein